MFAAGLLEPVRRGILFQIEAVEDDIKKRRGSTLTIQMLGVPPVAILLVLRLSTFTDDMRNAQQTVQPLHCTLDNDHHVERKTT